MAEEKKGGDKKPEKKPVGAIPGGFTLTEAIVLFIIIVALISGISSLLSGGVSSGRLSFFGIPFSSFADFFKNSAWFFKAIGFSFAGIGAVATFVFNKRGDKIWHEEKLKLYPAEAEVASVSDSVVTENLMVEKWKEIQSHAHSEISSNWRLCIIEADMILEDLLNTMSLPGDTIGEKLKAVEKSDFNTIEQAWEAHKIRNRIAHESDFLLNQRETLRIISLYEEVFKEFHLI